MTVREWFRVMRASTERSPELVEFLKVYAARSNGPNIAAEALFNQVLQYAGVYAPPQSGVMTVRRMVLGSAIMFEECHHRLNVDRPHVGFGNRPDPWIATLPENEAMMHSLSLWTV